VTDVPGEDFVPFPETPRLVDACIAAHPSGGRDCLLATTEDGGRLAFDFEARVTDPAFRSSIRSCGSRRRVSVG
jgi:hypothetical protein